MTPEEAAEWAADQPAHSNPMAVLNTDAACTQPGCLAPIYLDLVCADHWRLLVGYAGHAARRDEAERLERQFAL